MAAKRRVALPIASPAVSGSVPILRRRSSLRCVSHEARSVPTLQGWKRRVQRSKAESRAIAVMHKRCYRFRCWRWLEPLLSQSFTGEGVCLPIGYDECLPGTITISLKLGSPKAFFLSSSKCSCTSAGTAVPEMPE